MILLLTISLSSCVGFVAGAWLVHWQMTRGERAPSCLCRDLLVSPEDAARRGGGL